MTQPLLWDTPSQRHTVAPVVREARKSGRRSVSVGKAMLAYQDVLWTHGPVTDEMAARLLGVGVSSCTGRRGDWNATVPADRPLVVAVDRVKAGRTSRCRWAWVGPR